MNKRSQNQKAEDLLRLHANGDLLVLPNVWNPIGARILAAKGYPAVATASAALSASLGYADGERIQRSTLIEFLGRIARSVDVPVTADIEAGYADTPAELEETVRQVIESGVVGINIEDSLEEGGALRSVPEQAARIALVRQVADKLGLPLVINARIDCFLSALFADKSRAMEETAARAKVYSAAGADCIYPIGPGDEQTVRALRSRITGPINILGSPNAAPLSVLREIGVNRVSFGPFVFRSCLRRFVDIAEALRSGDGYACFSDLMAGAEVAPYLVQEQERSVAEPRPENRTMNLSNDQPARFRCLTDLRTQPPRSPRVRLGQFILLARCLDKCRAHLAGVAGEYVFDSMIDRWLFAFKGVTSDAFKAKVAEGLSDEEMLAWFSQAGSPRTEAEAMAWGQDVSRYSLSYDPTGDLHATLKRVEYLTAACDKYGLEPLTTPVLARLEVDDIRSFEKRT